MLNGRAEEKCHYDMFSLKKEDFSFYVIIAKMLFPFQNLNFKK